MYLRSLGIYLSLSLSRDMRHAHTQCVQHCNEGALSSEDRSVSRTESGTQKRERRSFDLTTQDIRASSRFCTASLFFPLFSFFTGLSRSCAKGGGENCFYSAGPTCETSNASRQTAWQHLTRHPVSPTLYIRLVPPPATLLLSLSLSASSVDLFICTYGRLSY